VRSLEHNLNMSHDSWHARWYRCWIKLGGKQKYPRENLCHYIRVLLFWAPMRWLFCGEVKEVPPYMAVGVAIYAVIFYASSIIVGVAFTALVLTVVSVRLFKRRKPDRSKEIMLKFKSVCGRISKSRFTKWLVGEGYCGFTPFGIMLGVAVVVGVSLLIIFAPVVLLKIVVYLVIVVVGISALVGMLIAYEKIKDRHVSKPIEQRSDGAVLDTLKLSATYLETKKAGSRVCPFISFEDTPSS
jgi:hypothetical protein